MPPSNSQPPIDPKDHLLPQGRKNPVGPVVGIIVIVILLSIGAFYFWGAHLNKRGADQLPFIPAENSTTSAY